MCQAQVSSLYVKQMVDHHWYPLRNYNSLTGVPQQNISWCKCEAVVQDMDHISVATEQAPPPPLVVMSLSVKITLNPKSGTNEVQCT